MKMNIKKVAILAVPAIILGLGSQECIYSKIHLTDYCKIEDNLNIHSDEADTSNNLEISEVNFPESKVQAEEEKGKEEEEEKDYSDAVKLTKREQEILLRVAYAEALNQDVEGKALVMLTILNRVNSDKFPDSIEEVVLAQNQFTTVSNGAYDRAELDDPGCLEALELVKSGYDSSQGATYFESIKSYDSWHYQNLNFLFEHGGHWFYN